ncbi:homeobox protein unc-4 homolog [Passer montanus]|uniref:homeobox protein unc-4 homolog n=1 Tax=Passer montanus TaxID=9160 RepID=UPI001961A15C|nr:homeobox protein unc-4 homolog [Passer montanus]
MSESPRSPSQLSYLVRHQSEPKLFANDVTGVAVSAPGPGHHLPPQLPPSAGLCSGARGEGRVPPGLPGAPAAAAEQHPEREEPRPAPPRDPPNAAAGGRGSAARRGRPRWPLTFTGRAALASALQLPPPPWACPGALREAPLGPGSAAQPRRCCRRRLGRCHLVLAAAREEPRLSPLDRPGLRLIFPGRDPTRPRPPRAPLLPSRTARPRLLCGRHRPRQQLGGGASSAPAPREVLGGQLEMLLPRTPLSAPRSVATWRKATSCFVGALRGAPVKPAVILRCWPSPSPHPERPNPFQRRR